MSTVYIVCFPTRAANGFEPDMTPATAYGACEVIFPRQYSPSHDPAALTTARERMKNFRAGDYLLFAGGDPFGLVLATLVANEKTGGRFRFLRWDRALLDSSDGKRRRRGGSYFPIDLNVKAGALVG